MPERFRGELLTIGHYTNPAFFTFLRASAMLKHVIAIGLTSVRPSVCLSVRLSVRHTLAPYQNG